MGAPLLPPAERVRLACQSRSETDYFFGYWSALGWTLLTFGIYSFYVVYQLVRRMRDHNARRLELLSASLSFAWDEATKRGLQEELTPTFQRAAWNLGGLNDMTGDFREPLVWVVLSFIARTVADIVLFVLLDQDLVRHDEAEVTVEEDLALIYARLGQPIPSPDRDRVKDRHNYVGRTVATVFSFGIYLFWWYYDVMAEPNRHFRSDWLQEDAMAGAVQALG